MKNIYTPGRQGADSHTVAAVGAYGILGVDLARDDAGVHVMVGAGVAVWALAQCVGVHFLELRPLLHCKQSTRLLPQTPQPLSITPTCQPKPYYCSYAMFILFCMYRQMYTLRFNSSFLFISYPATTTLYLVARLVTEAKTELTER